MKKHLLFIAFIAFFSINNLLAQERFEALYKIKGPIVSINEIDNNKDLQTIIADLAYNYNYGEKTAKRVMRYTHEKNWPEAINTSDKRKNPAVQKNILKYTAFSITSFKLDMFSNKDVYLLFIPKDKNEKMPEGYRPATDIFFLSTDAEFTKKNDKTDYKREDNLVSENYNFIKLNEIIYYFWYLNQMAVNNYYNRIDANGNQIFNQPLGRELNGFYENTYIKTPDGDCYAVSYYDAGTNAESAKATMKFMAELLSGGEFNKCNYKISKYNNPLALEAYRLISDKCPEKPIMIEFGVFENNKIDCKNKNKEGYSIMLSVKAVEDPALTYWSQLILNASKKMKDDGHWILNTCKGKDGILRCDFKFNSPMEISWDAYISYPDPSFYIYDEETKKEIILNQKATLYENNIWQFKGSMKLAPGEYRFMGNPPAGNIGYWAVCLGEKDDKAKQAEQLKAQKEKDELIAKAKESATAQLKKENYNDIFENTFSSASDSQYVRINYPNHKVQAFFITPHSDATVKVCNGKGQSVVKESNVTESKGLHLHGVYFEALPGNEYYVIIKNPSKKYDNSLLIYGVKK